MLNLTPLEVLPHDIVTDFRCELHKAVPVLEGSFRLVNIRRTSGAYQEGRLIVLVVDENGLPMPDIKVAFSYSSAGQYGWHAPYNWMPPPPHRADIFPTEVGTIEHIQNDPIKPGMPGGITTYVIEPEYSSDYITGCGMLADHTGLHLTFQLRRTGVTPLPERLAAIEARLDVLES